MPKAFEELAEKLNILGVPDKLRILELLAREGQKSISAVSKDLNIHFSTAHKYLEQLEKISLVSSKTLKEDRIKRYFHINEFDLRISPNTLGKDEKSAEEITFKVITNDGKKLNFTPEIFLKDYINAGLPLSVLKGTLDSIVAKKAYDGITTIELDQEFNRMLELNTRTIREALSSINIQKFKKLGYMNILRMVYPEALQKHISGEIFIHNLRKPIFFNFAHDLRGVSIHGVTGKKPETIKDVLSELAKGIKYTSEYVLCDHAINCFNYVLARYSEDLSEEEVLRHLSEFFIEINKLNIQIYLGIEYGLPRYAGNQSPAYHFDPTVKQALYAAFKNEAERLRKIIDRIFSTERLENIKYVLKCWKKPSPEEIKSGMHIANMIPSWQSENSTYVGLTRFDSDWKGWLSTNRVGELQSMSLNLLKLANESTNKEDFIKLVKNSVHEIIQYIISIADLSLGEIRKNKYVFSSAMRGRWDYVIISDSLYTIALYGLPEIINRFKLDIDKFMKQMNIILQEERGSLRIEFKEETNSSIAERFARITNSKLEIVEDKFIFDKYFKGGHFSIISRNQLDKFFEKEGGFALLLE